MSDIKKAIDELASEITNPVERAAFLATIKEETGFKAKDENLNYSSKSLKRLRDKGTLSKLRGMSDKDIDNLVSQGPEAIANRIYGGRLGNAPNEGYKFRGRGLFQITGKNNYSKISKELFPDAPNTLIDNPELINSPENIKKVAKSYWSKISSKVDFNQENAMDKVTDIVNPKTHTRDRRNQYFQEYMQEQPQNNMGDLSPMQDTQGAEMAKEIEQPEEEFELVSSPEEEEFELVSEPDFYAGTEEPSMMESFARGAATGASFGKAEELIAGTEAGTTVLKAKLQSYFDTMMKQDDMPATSLSEAYDKALNEQNEAFKEAARANPVSYLAGDIAGSFASTVATMGFGSWIKGGQALNAGSKAFLHSMNGFAHGVGRSEEDTISGVLGEGAQGAALGLAGEIFAASKGVQAASKATDNLGKVRAGAFVKYLGAKFDTVDDNLSKVGKDAISFAERMVNKTIKVKGPAGEIIEQPLILSNMSRKDMLKRVNMEADVQGSMMGDILAEADSALDISFSGSHLKNELMEDFILPMKNSNIPEHKAVAARLERYVEDMTEHVVEKTKSIDPKTGNFFYNSKTAPAEFRLKDLHEIKSFLQKQARKYRGRSADSVEEMVYQQKDAMGTRLGEIIEEAIGFGGDISGKPFLEKYSAARTAYGDLAETSKILQNTIQQDSGKQFFQKIFNDRLASYATVAGGVAATAGIPYGSTILAAGALKGIANSKVVNGVLAKSANTLAQAIEANPEKLAGIASKLVTASTLSANDFVDTFMEASAEATFLATPLARDPMEVVRRSSSVLSLVKGFDRNVAKDLEKAINMTDLDSINNIMAEIASKVPAGYIEEGVGFGGKAYTESDIAAVNTYLQNIKNTRKRMMLTTDFNKNGLVPGEMLAPKEEPSNVFVHDKAKKDFRKKEY